ncbi:MAG: efflux RND transporter periplasmic adaptor subunit [Gallionellaceae bacterium]
MKSLLLRQLRSLFVLASFIAPGALPSTFAHGGESEVGGGARGPMQLSAAQQKAIALQVANASLRPLSIELNLNGEVQLLPDRQAEVSLRISGQITALYANLGDRVRAAQRLALVQSRLVGDPPPSVTINAPRSGVIDARNVVVGQAVEPNTVLFHISDRSQVVAVARVYEEDIGKIKTGQETRVRVPGYPQRVFTGKVMLIDPNLDPINRTVKVWIKLANPQGLLKPGMFARASVILRRNEAALTIPNSAIIEANGEKFVFVRGGDKYNRVEISIGATDDEYSEITDGLVPGDEVVTQGNRQIYTMWLTGGQMKAEE